MENLCSQKHHPSHHHYLSKRFREVDIPPRKLLSRRPSASLDSPINPYDFLMDSPMSEENAMFQKFLPSNKLNADNDEDPYLADPFRMYEFKIRKCNRSRSHDWMDCPFAHPGEKARRRDPRRFNYSGTVCPEYRRRAGRLGFGCNGGRLGDGNGELSYSQIILPILTFKTNIFTFMNWEAAMRSKKWEGRQRSAYELVEEEREAAAAMKAKVAGERRWLEKGTTDLWFRLGVVEVAVSG